ncbi:MAG: acylneuraminate cytidylyltransferase family protein [Candidatus Thiodiazotropha sp.]
MRIVALLPIKANSVRVTGKNFRSLNGKALFRWILDTLLSIEIIDLVVINTDAVEILKQHGITSTHRLLIRNRPAELRGDEVSMNLILADDISKISADLYLMTHATNPLISDKTIENAITTFQQSNQQNDSLFSVDKIQARFYRADGSPINHDPNNLIQTQQLEPWYKENSNIYLFTYESFMQTKSRVGLNPILFETPLIESIDIDSYDDFELCEIISAQLHSKKQ